MNHHQFIILFISNRNFTCTFNHIVGTVSFSRPLYFIREDSGMLQPEIILSNPLSINLTITIEATNITARSK